MRKQTRAPLLTALRNAINIARYSKKQKSPSANELIDMQVYHIAQRRNFIGNIVKTGVAVSAASILNACNKITDIIPPSSLSKSTDRKKNQPEIVIIGAGMAGLHCAYQLKKAGYTSTIYEGSSRTGGRIFTKNDIIAKGLYSELGGEFIDSEHEDMLRLCHEFGLSLLDTRSAEESNYVRDSFYIEGRFYSAAEVITAFQPYSDRIDADINSLPDEITYDDYTAATLHFDKMSVAGYLDEIGMTGFIRKGIEIAYLTEYGLNTDEQSAINFLYLFSPDTSEGFNIFGSSDERYKIEGGNQRLTTLLYQQLKKDVIAEHQLIKIKETSAGYSLYFTNANGSTVTVKADLVVLAIPFSILRDVVLEIDLPLWKTNAIRNLGYGTNSKLLLGFNSRVWRKYQYSGYAFTDKGIQNGWDNSWTQPGKSGGYTVFQGGTKGLELGTGTADSQAPHFVEQLDKMWPGCKTAFNGNAKRMHWPAYTFTKGSYSCYKVGQYTSVRGAEIKPVGNLYFAGEHCSLDFQGYMNGAAETGRRAAQAILKAIKSGQSIVSK